MGAAVRPLAGARATILGRLARIGWAAAAEAIAAAGGSLRRGVSRRTGLAVVGERAHVLVDDGRLRGRLGAVDRVGATAISEGALLRLLGLAPALPSVARDVPLAAVAAQARLDPWPARALALFDVVQPDAEGMCGFRDLVSARQMARLLADGSSLGAALAAALDVRPVEDAANLTDRLARVRLDSGPDGGIVQRIGAATARLDGQMLLPLPEAGNPPVDEMMEQALAAEEDGDLERAETLYRRCADADRADPTAAYNLGNVLRRQERARAARVQYERALGMDRHFVEARYNLAHVLEGGGDLDGARAQLGAALRSDSRYADAWFNLAGLRYRARDFAGAIECWERYLKLDAEGEWADRAHRSLALCRMELSARR